MDLLSYFRILRRHWVLLLVFVVVGAAIGGATAVASGDTTTGTKSNASYYKATNTLILRNRSSASAFPSTFTNLDQIALLATTGPVPTSVAQKLGGSLTGDGVAQRLTTLTQPAAGTLAITAVGQDSEETTTFANTVADQLIAQIKSTDLDAYNQAKSDAEKQVTTIQGKIDDTKAQLAAVPKPANADVLAQQLTALEDQYSQVYGAYQLIEAQDAPASPVSTLQKASSIPIRSSEYNTRLNQGRLGQNNLQAGGNSQVAAAAAAASDSSLKGPLPRAVFGGLLGLVLGIGVVMLREHLDRRVRSRADVEHAYRWPVLAEVPTLSQRDQKARGILANSKPMAPGAEAYRSVRSSVLFQLAAAERADGSAVAGPNTSGGDGFFEPAASESVVMMVVSAMPAEGKTTSVANLATVCAQAGSRVLVVNCDFRKPMIHQYFGVDDLPRRVQATSVPGVSIITNVVRDEDATPAQVVGVQRQVIAAAKDRFDLVILDTAPILGANDAVDLAPEVDVVVVVARSGVTRVPSAERVGEQLRRIEAPVAGVVLLGAGEGENGYYADYQRERRNGRARKSTAVQSVPAAGPLPEAHDAPNGTPRPSGVPVGETADR
jgi:Mrp family chromosome partitioning ATPase/capsular polysaccharide biosynthesis protein